MRFRFIIKHYILIFISLLSITSFCQQTSTNTNVLSTYNNALKLYNNKAYAASQSVFLKIKEAHSNNFQLKSDASYYEAMCAIKLNQTDADKKVLNFVDDNPNSTKKNKAYFNVANYYFSNKKAAYALKWYQKIDTDVLSTENKKEYDFKKGYCFLTTNNLTQAKKHFLPLINDAKYGNDSRYYFGYISYKQEDYDVAASTLKEIADNESYKAEISYYLLDICFKAGKFNRCVNVGTKLLQNTPKKDVSEISKIVGQSYFNLKKYKEAIPYLKAYKGKRGRWSNNDYYQLGYAFYKQGDYKNTIKNFNKITNKNNTISQNAYYHLGECYLKLKQKTEALNAFKTASEMDFNTEIKQDAALNYAKLSYEEGNPFKSVAAVLQDYLKAYPKSTSYNEINKLVISSFIHQQDYKGVLTFLEKKKSEENIALILEVSLYRGIQLFNDKKIKEALSFFTESKKSKNSEVNLKAFYWEAETTYRLQNYKEALTKFIDLKKQLNNASKNMFPLVDYNIGYCNFKLKEYTKSIVAFNSFITKENLEFDIKNDALIRLGDSYFATRNYTNSIKSFQKVISNSGAASDYSQYQIGMSYGFLGENDLKIDALISVVNNYTSSLLKDDALYQLANTYTTIKDSKNAHVSYNRLIEKHPKSIFLPKALVRQGLLYYNDNKNEKALEKYKQTTSKFPNSPDAFEAVTNARNIYIEDGKLDDYVTWIKTLKFFNVTNKELDNATYAVAEKRYLDATDSNKIVNSLFKYTREFPNGVHKLKASFYLAETLFKTNDFKKATTYYKIVLDEEQNEFSEESLNKLAQVYLLDEDLNNALPLLSRLEEEAYATENVLFAQSNLMKGYYENESYSFAIEYAEKLLKRDKLAKNLQHDAQIIIAKASFKTNNLLIAEEYYQEIEKNATGELKAEAIYYNAYFKNQQKEYLNSNKIVQNLIANYSSYKYWAVKSYVIMGKNHHALKDIYQATFVLENVIKNFQQFEDIINEAQIELNKIKTVEIKTNNSTKKTNKETKN